MNDTTASLRKVASGLGLVYAGLCMIVFAILLPFLAFPVMGGPHRLVIIATGLLLITGIVLDTVGRLLCLAMPQERSGAKIIIILAVAFDLIALVFSLLNLAKLFIPNLMLPPVLALVQTPMSIVGSVLFVMFLRMLALYVGREDLAGRAILVLILGGVLVALLVVIVAMAFMSLQRGPQPGAAGTAVGILGLVTLVLGIVELVLYGNLLTYLRKAVLEDSENQSELDDTEDQSDD
jgi:hypothetical protein